MFWVIFHWLYVLNILWLLEFHSAFFYNLYCLIVSFYFPLFFFFTYYHHFFSLITLFHLHLAHVFSLVFIHFTLFKFSLLFYLIHTFSLIFICLFFFLIFFWTFFLWFSWSFPLTNAFSLLFLFLRVTVNYLKTSWNFSLFSICICISNKMFSSKVIISNSQE